MTRPRAGVSALAGWRTFLLSLRNVCLPSQSKEQEPVPSGAGDFDGDSAERPVLPPVVLEPVVQHFDDVSSTFKVPSQERPGHGQAVVTTTAARPDGGHSGPTGRAAGRPKILRRSNPKMASVGDPQRAPPPPSRQPPLGV